MKSMSELKGMYTEEQGWDEAALKKFTLYDAGVTAAVLKSQYDIEN